METRASTRGDSNDDPLHDVSNELTFIPKHNWVLMGLDKVEDPDVHTGEAYKVLGIRELVRYSLPNRQYIATYEDLAGMPQLRANLAIDVSATSNSVKGIGFRPDDVFSGPRVKINDHSTISLERR